MFHKLDQLQLQFKRENLQSCDPKTCLDALRTQFKEFVESKKMKEREVKAIKEIEKRLKEREIHQSGNENKSSDNESSSSGYNVTDAKKILVDTVASDIENADIGPSYNINTVSEVHHDMFENMFVHGIQNHERSESIPKTYVVNENNSNIIFDIPNMDPNRDMEEHDYVDYEKQRAFFASLINNLKCDVEKCTKVNHEAQQANALLTKELERYKEKEKHFAKDKTIKSEYLKKIKILNDKISNLKSQACLKDKTFAKENGKYDEYVQPLLKRKNEHENKNQEFYKQINDLDNKLRKAGQTDQTLRMLFPKEDNVKTGKEGLGFENKNDIKNPILLNKAKKLAPILYNIEEMGKDLLSNHNIISEEELKCEAEKSLKVKQQKSLLSYHGSVYGETQYDEPPKVPLKRRDVNLKKHLEQAQLKSKLASQDLISNQKEYSDLRTSYNALKAMFDVLNREKGKSPMSNFSTPKVSASPKIYTGESSKSFPKRVSQFTTYSLQKDKKFSKKAQGYETLTSQKVFNSSDSSRKSQVLETPNSSFTPVKQVWRPKQIHSKPFK
ncbi:hypothetical protein Tco_1005979 [Tanacetum coccineum]|uniref:Uncharacterized protein n=1 Tax=Tanacetum coccineum TaxID=301880 RepID=A0ABQ5FGU5_9ASTR